MSPRALLGLAAAALGGGALWWRHHPSACPYGQRWLVEQPHPFITRNRLREVLQPAPGERMLEIGPGTGYYSLPVAEWLGSGRLDIFDIQQEMLDLTLRRATERGHNNITAAQGDAQELPYPDEVFDAAYLVTVLGEIPNQQAALRELGRVVRPGGRIIVGELFGDPHWVAPGSLRRRAEAEGLTLSERIGTPLAYFARLEPVGRSQA